MFARGEVGKTHLARAGESPSEFSRVICSRTVKERSRLQSFDEVGVPNAETYVEHLGAGLYRLTPRTGRTYQLSVHMASLGLPILDDPPYTVAIAVAPEDFSTPLRILAWRLEFTDPSPGRRGV